MRRRRTRSEFGRANWLIVHGVSLEAWCRRWELEPFTVECGGCGKEMRSDVPFASGSLRGLVARPCPCGHYDPCHCGRRDHRHIGLPYCVVRDPRHGDLFSGAPK